MSRLSKRSTAVALALAAAAIGATAWTTLRAQGPLIQACASTRDGALRLAVGGCDTRREVPVEWNQQGPAGPAGPEGPRGPSGPIASIGLPVGPVVTDRRAAGCETGSNETVRTATVNLGPGDYRVTTRVSEVLQVTGTTGAASNQMDFDHATTGARVAISYYRLYDKDAGVLQALNSSSFRLTETTPVLVTMRTVVRGCGYADMAGAVAFDRTTFEPPASED